jgi:hypothetical protein
MSRLLNVIGGFLIVFGLFGLAVELQDAIDGKLEDAFLGITFSLEFVGMGASALIAVKSRYKVGWANAIGLIVLALGLWASAIELDEYRKGDRKDVVPGAFFSLAILTGGALLVRSGHHAHVRAQRDQEVNREPAG